MTILLVWALIAGQPVVASHEFGVPAACNAVRALVIEHLKNEKAEKIVAVCVDGMFAI